MDATPDLCISCAEIMQENSRLISETPMAMSRAAHWLQQALLDQCSDSNAALQLEPEVVSSLVSYCQIASASEAQQYLYVSYFSVLF